MIAFTREVPRSLAECELTHVERTPIDVDAARAEHDAYENALHTLGCEVRRLASPDDQPDAVFIEDAAVVLDELAIVTRPGAESRRGETAVVAGALEGLRPLARIAAPGTLDGGDVLRIGQRIYVGVGGRTNESGVEQLRAIVAPHGYTVKAVAVRGALHLKTAVTQISNDLVLVNPEWVDDTSFDGMGALPVHPSEPFGANALLVGDRLVHGAQYERTRRRLEAVNLRVVAVPMRELAKAEAGVTCCSILVKP
ncbi:MAG: dimethylargininase [Gemmatimonadaceae bacterium]|nr:dimethylargininase [Gemmatimonadaceae bacterium]NUQ93492.1 dimethylargininase [Gemmatimonadaceae bacterium]NUR19172.1 dimethylargininase [Gemmatimonadaceae bacterium]